MKTTLEKCGTRAAGKARPSTWLQGWREIGGVRIFFRSRWEFNYALHLDILRTSGYIIKWEHEPETFWFEKIRRGCRSYLPDFRVTLKDGSLEYHEVKGWMDARSKTKIKRMAKYHPAIVLRVIDASWFRVNGGKLSGIIPEWESIGRPKRLEKKNAKAPSLKSSPPDLLA